MSPSSQDDGAKPEQDALFEEISLPEEIAEEIVDIPSNQAAAPSDLPFAGDEPIVATPNLGRGIAATFAALLFWSWPAVLAKALPLDAMPIVFYRGWLGAAFALAVLYGRGARLDLRILRIALPAGIALALDILFFFTALKLTTVTNAMVISTMQPALLIFAAPIFFGEKLRWPDISTAMVAVGGVILVVMGATDIGSWSARGDFLAFLTLLAWTAYLAASKKAREEIGPVEFAAAVSLIAAVLCTPVALALGGLPNPEPIQWLGLTLMAISGWCGHTLMNWALAHVPLWIGGTTSLAIPVLTALMAAAFLAEPILPLQILGMFIALSALAVVIARARAVAGPG